MCKLQLISLANDLFQQKFITKVELEEFKAKEKAINEIFDFKLSINEKKENLGLRKLKNLEQRIDYSQELIKKIKKINGSDNDLLRKKKTNMLEILENFISISTNEIKLNYFDFLSVETKKEFFKIEDIKYKGE